MEIKIGNFKINEGSETFIIAELSANHGNDIEIAKQSIKKAKEVGANCVKLQTYTADTITLDCRNEYFKLNSGTIWDGTYLYDLYNEASMSWGWHKELFDYAKKIGILIFSSPFDKSAVDFLENLSVPAYKVASFEITDIPLIKYIASKQKPVIISTGIATLEEIEDAVEVCRSVGNEQIILLKCTSSYPSKPEDANLKTIKDMKKRFGVEVGLSDHTKGTVVSVMSVGLGAKVVEKHFTINKDVESADSSFSLDEKEFKKLVEDIRTGEKSLGKVDYEMTKSKKNNRLLSRSLFFVEDIKENEEITEKHVRSIRPSYGIEPKYIEHIIGRKAIRDIKKGTPVTFELIKNST